MSEYDCEELTAADIRKITGAKGSSSYRPSRHELRYQYQDWAGETVYIVVGDDGTDAVSIGAAIKDMWDNRSTSSLESVFELVSMSLPFHQTSLFFANIE